MGNFFGCMAAGVGWCCCTAAGSLLSSCCGTDKPSTVPPSVNSGRKRSVLLLTISIALSFFFQYWLGPELIERAGSINPVLSYMGESWADGCEMYMTMDENGNESFNEDLRDKCAGNNGVYRVAGATLLFYVLAGIGAACKPTANREAWPAKFILYLFLVAGMIFIPNEPLFSPILLNIFRVGGAVFIVFYQLIILDMAYNINEACVEKADKAELDEGEGAGKKWLGALLFSSAFLFISSLVVIGVMFHLFTGCTSNTTFIAITLVLGVLTTVVQLTGEEASLFTSACIFAYSTYLCYTAVSKNPNGECNPQLGDDSIENIIVGIAVAIISILWTSYSTTAHKAVREESDDVGEEEHDREGTVGGVVINDAPNENSALQGQGGGVDLGSADGKEEPKTFSSSWKLNLILGLICCWYAVSLTSWGTIIKGGNIANPVAGDVGMWMIIASQWLMNALYFWTLVAAKFFPDRDFS